MRKLEVVEKKDGFPIPLFSAPMGSRIELPPFIEADTINRILTTILNGGEIDFIISHADGSKTCLYFERQSMRRVTVGPNEIKAEK